MEAAAEALDSPALKALAAWDVIAKHPEALPVMYAADAFAAVCRAHNVELVRAVIAVALAYGVNGERSDDPQAS